VPYAIGDATGLDGDATKIVDELLSIATEAIGWGEILPAPAGEPRLAAASLASSCIPSASRAAGSLMPADLSDHCPVGRYRRQQASVTSSALARIILEPYRTAKLGTPRSVAEAGVCR
jgi:hypothetical protein